MSKYIEVGHLKKSVEGLHDCYNEFSDTYDKACIIGLIDEEPTADVVPVVRGRWCIEPGIGCICSACQFDIGNDLDWMEYVHFCPNCGAKMDEVSE